MSTNLSYQFEIIRINFENFSKLAALFDDWFKEYTYRVELDLKDVQSYDDTIVRNVRNKDERFCHLVPEVCENEKQWENILGERLNDLKKRMSYVQRMRGIILQNVESFKQTIAKCPSAEEAEHYTELLRQLGTLPVVQQRESAKKTVTRSSVYP